MKMENNPAFDMIELNKTILKARRSEILFGLFVEILGIEINENGKIKLKDITDEMYKALQEGEEAQNLLGKLMYEASKKTPKKKKVSVSN